MDFGVFTMIPMWGSIHPDPHNCGLAFILETILRLKEELWKLSNISSFKNIISEKSSKRNQILEDIITL
jgi:hypothetical protein